MVNTSPDEEKIVERTQQLEKDLRTMNRYLIFGSIALLSACAIDAQQSLEASRVVSSDAPSLDSSEGWYMSGPATWERMTEDGTVERVSRGSQGLAADLDAARTMREQLDPENQQAMLMELDERIEALESMQALLENTPKSQKIVRSCYGQEWRLTATANCTHTQGSAYARSEWSMGFSPRQPSETYASARAYHDGDGEYNTDTGDSFNAAEASASDSVTSSEICSSRGFASVSSSYCDGFYESFQVTCRCY